jgi:hypothetical protein
MRVLWVAEESIQNPRRTQARRQTVFSSFTHNSNGPVRFLLLLRRFPRLSQGTSASVDFLRARKASFDCFLQGTANIVARLQCVHLCIIIHHHIMMVSGCTMFDFSSWWKVKQGRGLERHPALKRDSMSRCEMKPGCDGLHKIEEQFMHLGAFHDGRMLAMESDPLFIRSYPRMKYGDRDKRHSPTTTFD